QALADDRAGHLQHLPHPGAALGALVADDDDVALLDLPALDRLEGVLLAVEDPRGAGVALLFAAGELDHAALGREIAAQDRDAAGLLLGLFGREDHLLSGLLRRALPFLEHPLAC